MPYDEAFFNSDGEPIIHPGSKVFQYGYELFEGAKAHPYKEGEIATFRLDENAKRFNRSARILQMPTIPEDYFIEGVNALLDFERNWMPIGQEGASLYIRPFMIQTEDSLGPRPGNESLFVAMLSPSGPYFSNGFAPTSLLVQDLFYRANHGGVGRAKAGGNYAGASRPTEIAHLFGAKQCLFMNPYNEIEEVGTSGFGMVRNGVLVLPELTDTILDSITVRSVKELAEKGYFSNISRVEEEKITIDSLLSGIESGDITDVFGLGTAAVVAPIGELKILKQEMLDPEKVQLLRRGEIYPNQLIERDISDYVDTVLINNGEIGQATREILDTYTGIQTGILPDDLGWMEIVDRIYENPLMDTIQDITIFSN